MNDIAQDMLTTFWTKGKRIIHIIALLGFLLAAGIVGLIGHAVLTADYSKGTPYENVNTCMADRGCAERFTEYLDCKATYRTGCD